MSNSVHMDSLICGVPPDIVAEGFGSHSPLQCVRLSNVFKTSTWGAQIQSGALQRVAESPVFASIYPMSKSAQVLAIARLCIQVLDALACMWGAP